MARPRKENADYFSHDTNMRSHRKVIALRSKFWITWYAVYSMLLEHIASCDFFKAKHNDIELEILAGDFWIDWLLLKDIVDFCHRLWLIQIVDWYIECQSMIERLQDLIKKRDRERSRDKPKDWEWKFISVTEIHSNDTEMPQSKVKESKVKENNILSEQDIKNHIKQIYTEEIVNNNIHKYRLLLLFIMKWYNLKIDKKNCDKFFSDMIDNSHRYGYSWEWFADRDTLLLKAKEMYEWAEWWREIKNHMSTLNKFLSPNPKK